MSPAPAKAPPQKFHKRVLWVANTVSIILRGWSHLMAYLPTSLHFFSARDAAGVTCPFCLPQKWKPGQGLPPSPPSNPYPPANSKIRQKGPEASADSVHHRNLHGDFSCGAGQRTWTFLSRQPSNDGQITSRIKGRGQRWSGFLWEVQESQVRPLGCSPSMLDVALLRRMSTSVVSHGLRNVARHTCCWVCARTACSRQWCARALHACAGVRPLHACTHDMCTSFMLYFTPFWINSVYKLSSLEALKRWREAGESKDDARPLQRFMFTGYWIYAQIEKQTDSPDTQHANDYSELDWGMWTWHPVWPPSTSLSLGNWDFSSRKFIDIHTHRICVHGNKSRVPAKMLHPNG